MPKITTGRFLKQGDITEEGTIHTILSVDEQDVSAEDDEPEMKWVLGLSDLKPLILNATNINRLIQAFKSNESEAWIGQKILVYVDPDVEFGGKIVGGVRLRSVKGKAIPPPMQDDRVPF